ncbi:MAG: hypothetical protein ACTXOO_02115 [Sodalis sp. (in: enterobacteria)]
MQVRSGKSDSHWLLLRRLRSARASIFSTRLPAALAQASLSDPLC